MRVNNPQRHPIHSPPGSWFTSSCTHYVPHDSSHYITPSAFYSGLKTHLFRKSFPPSLPGSFWTAFSDLEPVLY